MTGDRAVGSALSGMTGFTDGEVGCRPVLTEVSVSGEPMGQALMWRTALTAREE